ncbi:hypothetical protein ACGFZP_22875 [Kitasatospora sp. NPDC048239]|uniref:hypothetical protein n=1 Tax=Kitasatospora sp. NPDC048239 TaxID=3364046 RepID=UPI0037227025
MALDQFMKECPGGYQIQAADVMAYGTLGATVMWDGKLASITAGHVVDSVGAPVFQPSWHGRRREDVHIIGRVSGRSKYFTYRDAVEYTARREDMLYDFAWMAPVAGETVSQIPGIYTGDGPLGTRDPKDGEVVSWLGKSTGAVQHGRVVDVDRWVFRGDNQQGYISLGPCTQIEGGNGLDGDSGAAIVSQEDGKVIGVHIFAETRTRTYTLASRIPPTSEDLIQHSTQTVDEETHLRRLEKWRNSRP